MPLAVRSPTPTLCALAAAHAEGSAAGAQTVAADAMRAVSFRRRSPVPLKDMDSVVLQLGIAADSEYGDRRLWHTKWLDKLLNALEGTEEEGEARLAQRARTSAFYAIKAIKQAGQGEARDLAQQRETEETLRNLETLVMESASLALSIQKGADGGGGIAE